MARGRCAFAATLPVFDRAMSGKGAFGSTRGPVLPAAIDSDAVVSPSQEHCGSARWVWHARTLLSVDQSTW